MGVTQEVLASAITDDPTKIVMAIPPTAVAVGAAARSFTIVHKSEMGVRTRRGAPMLKPEISGKIIEELASELPDLRFKYFSWEDVYLEPPTSELPDLRTVSNYVKGKSLEIRNHPKRKLAAEFEKHDIKERVAEKVDNLDDEVKARGIYQVVGQGLVWLTPFIDSVVKISIADQTTALQPFEIESADERDRQLLIQPGITWNVRPDADNPYNALFNINNEKETKIKTKTQELEQTVSWICAEGLGIVLRDKTYAELKSFDPNEVTEAMQELCREGLLRYGVELDRVRLKPVARTPAERVAQAIEGNPDLTAGEKAAIVASSAISSGEKNYSLSLVPDKPAS